MFTNLRNWVTGYRGYRKFVVEFIQRVAALQQPTPTIYVALMSLLVGVANGVEMEFIKDKVRRLGLGHMEIKPYWPLAFEPDEENETKTVHIHHSRVRDMMTPFLTGELKIITNLRTGFSLGSVNGRWDVTQEDSPAPGNILDEVAPKMSAKQWENVGQRMALLHAHSYKNDHMLYVLVDNFDQYLRRQLVYRVSEVKLHIAEEYTHTRTYHAIVDGKLSKITSTYTVGS